MTSKISYIKLVREDIRHRGWLAALTWIVLVLAMPVHSMLYIDSFLGGSDPNRWTEWGQYIQDQMPWMVNGYFVTYVAYVIVVLGALAALTGYSYIHSREKSDFYHALPLRRGQWFAVSYVSGAVIFVIPYVICSGLTALVGAAYHIMTPEILGKMALAAAGGLLAYFIVYHVCILAAMLTGQTVTGILASLVIAVYPALLFGMIPMLKSTFFETYSMTGTPLSDRLASYVSPAGAFIKAIQGMSHGASVLSVLLSALLMIAVLLAAAVLLYRIYPAEASGRALSFPGTAPVIKVLICIPAALFCGLFVREILGIGGTRWMFLLTLFAAVLLCGLIEFICRQDLRLLLKGWRSSLLSIAIVLAVLCMFRFDVFGYDAYLPKEDKVESMSMSSYSFTGYFEYPEELGKEAEELETYGAFAENFEPIYRLAEEGVKNAENGLDPREIYSGNMDDSVSEAYIQTTICYKFKSGRKVVRDYCVDRESVITALEELCQDDGYRQELFPVFMAKKENISSIALWDIYGGKTEQMELTEEERGALLAAYKEDLLEVDMRTLAEASPVGEIELYAKTPNKSEAGSAETNNAMPVETSYSTYWNGIEPGGISLGTQYIYEGFEHTLACLEDYGYTLSTKIDPEEVTQVWVYLPKEALESGKLDAMLSEISDEAEYTSYPDMDDELNVRSQDDISIIAEHLKATGNSFLSGDRDAAYASVDFKKGMSYNFVVE